MHRPHYLWFAREALLHRRQFSGLNALGQHWRFAKRSRHFVEYDLWPFEFSDEVSADLDIFVIWLGNIVFVVRIIYGFFISVIIRLVRGIDFSIVVIHDWNVLVVILLRCRARSQECGHHGNAQPQRGTPLENRPPRQLARHGLVDQLSGGL
jgi:hypothetical protein